MHGSTGNTWFSAGTATFGDRLTAAREAAGLSQQDLAQRLGVRAKTVAHWEQDAAEPRANRTQMLAGMLNVSLMWLLTGEGDGVGAPGDEAEDSARAINGLLREMRRLNGEMTALTNRLGQVETRLRHRLSAARDHGRHETALMGEAES